MLLFLIIIFLFFGIISLFFINDKNISFAKTLSLVISSIVLILSVSLLLKFESFPTVINNFLSINSESCLSINNLNFILTLNLNGIGLFFFVLSSLLIFLCILFLINSQNDDNNIKNYLLNLLIIELFLLLVFSVTDLFLFYVFFEAILIPMYLLIGIWGSRQRKVRAVYLFFFYTLCGSIMMLLGILYIFSVFGTLNLDYLATVKFTKLEQIVLWLCFFLSFASKIPMFPFHIWLPEAHVEAPTVGSVLLAGILLKLGVYGFLRFSLTLFPEGSLFFSPMVYLLSIVGVLYASLNAIRQTDLKRIIAYSSIAHMNLVTIGIFSFNIIGIEGAILQSISHGFVSGGLFLLVGVLYDRYHTRFLYYYGGLAHMMPLYAIFFLIFTLANIALPGTGSFVGEFLILAGIYKTNIIISIVSALGVILCGAYSLWLYNRIIFGNLKINYTLKFNDLNFREFSVLFPLFILIWIMGIYPSCFSSYIHASCCNLSFLTI